LIDAFPQPSLSPIFGVESSSPRQSIVSNVDDANQRMSTRHASRMTASSMASIPLFAVIEEGTRRIPSMPPPISEDQRNESPFGDENEVKDKE